MRFQTIHVALKNIALLVPVAVVATERLPSVPITKYEGVPMEYAFAPTLPTTLTAFAGRDTLLIAPITVAAVVEIDTLLI
jgi:hypothetical protein